MKKFVIDIFILLGIAVCFVLYFANLTEKYNNKKHGADVQVTEWVSPDGVHYWYQQAGYHAMLAPRYDNNGNLVID